MGEQNFKGQLIAYCNKLELAYRFGEPFSTGPSHDPRFTYSVFVNNEKVGEGEDKKKRTAANIAAKMALMSLQKREHKPNQARRSEPVVHPMTSASGTSTEHSTVNGVASKLEEFPNYVGRFNEYCQKRGFRCYSFVDARRGPDHIPEFFCSAVIDERTFPEAKGKNKKDAKQNAARLALKVLKMKEPTNVQLQQIPGLDDADLMQATSTSESQSANKMSSSLKMSENLPSKPITTAQPSCTETPIHPSKPHRRIAANFSNQEQVNDKPTEDKLFLQDFDNIIRLGSGGYGTVFKARKKLDQKDYAVKKVKRRSEKDVSEVKALAVLEHPHIVRYYHSWSGEDLFSDESCSGDGQNQKLKCLFIQMEWCAKGTLEDWIESMEKIDKLKSLDIFQQIVDGVAYIHSKKLIHRDLKPPNILFAEDMVVKIADFGLVTPISEKIETPQLLRTVKMGTKRYMAPEQENDTYENEVDIFALGLILVELFCKFGSCHAKQKEWEKLRNADLPPELAIQFPFEASRIKLMLSKDPKKRPTAVFLKEYFKSKSVFHSNTL
ncbi:interferon-induced, double-stranded RNA-activated protein kinase-like isoform X2 [Rana temporaria]|uniref:interferon-induced, double-stranded RNA-activated protein kinase-like isoform X2 n=1 Tax=Rana temporaria TaxID=8407 RepID=UPI001AACA1C5|nr:interferon-induced, double-stranded RNA-activated protein kinase-like isoform X2 [Rana temporaria]